MATPLPVLRNAPADLHRFQLPVTLFAVGDDGSAVAGVDDPLVDINGDWLCKFSDPSSAVVRTRDRAIGRAKRDVMCVDTGTNSVTHAGTAAEVFRRDGDTTVFNNRAVFWENGTRAYVDAVAAGHSVYGASMWRMDVPVVSGGPRALLKMGQDLITAYHLQLKAVHSIARKLGFNKTTQRRLFTRTPPRQMCARWPQSIAAPQGVGFVEDH